MAKKKSASQLAAEAAYFREHNIIVHTPEPQKKGGKTKTVAILNHPTNPDVQGLGSVKDFGIYISSINTAKPVVNMTDEEIVKKLLMHYDAVLKHIIGPNMVREAFNIKEYLKAKNCNRGVCRCARLEFGVRIAERWWVTQFPEGYLYYWFDTPDRLYEVKELINSISLRVERLQEILNSMQ